MTHTTSNQMKRISIPFRLNPDSENTPCHRGVNRKTFNLDDICTFSMPCVYTIETETSSGNVPLYKSYWQ